MRFVSYFICVLIDADFETVAILGEFRHFTDVFFLPFQSYTLKEMFSFKRQMRCVNNSVKEHRCFEILF